MKSVTSSPNEVLILAGYAREMGNGTFDIFRTLNWSCVCTLITQQILRKMKMFDTVWTAMVYVIMSTLSIVLVGTQTVSSLVRANLLIVGTNVLMTNVMNKL